MGGIDHIFALGVQHDDSPETHSAKGVT